MFNLAKKKENIFIILIAFALVAGGVFLFLPRFSIGGQPAIIDLEYLTIHEIGDSHAAGADKAGGTQACQVGLGDLDLNCPVGTPCSCDAQMQEGYYYRIEFQVANDGATVDNMSGYYDTLGSLNGIVDTANDIWVTDGGADEVCSSATWSAGRLTWPSDDVGCDLELSGPEVGQMKFIIQAGAGAGDTSGANLYAQEDVGLATLTAGVEISVVSSGYLYFSVDSNSQTFPDLTPGTLVATTSILQVKTDSSTGFYVTLERDDADTTMDLNTDAAVNITDKTEWIAPTATTTVGTATASTTEPQTLQFRVRQAGTDVPNYASDWWGTDDTTANALFAGFASSTAPTDNKKIIIRSTAAVASTTAIVLYNLDAPIVQETGTYSGGITYTVTANP